MSDPKNHHYISRFYLKNFTESGGEKEMLFAYDKVKNNYFESNPENICRIKNFNKISFPGKEYIVETEQSKIESIFAISFKAVIETKNYPNDEQLIHILNFIALVSLRNPKTRAIFDRLYKNIADKFMSMTMESEEIYKDQCLQAGIKEEDIIPYEKQKKSTEDKSSYTLEVNQEVHIKSEFKAIDNLVNILYQRNWYLIISDETIGEFITSDYPVSIAPLNKSDNLQHLGFGMENTEVCFPISKYLAFIGVFEDNKQKKFIATKDIINKINKATYDFANKQVFSTKKIDFNI